MTREIVKNSCIVYRNESRKLHQEDDKPSYIQFDGLIHFCKKDKQHRKGKPARIWFNGTIAYWENDKFVKLVQR